MEQKISKKQILIWLTALYSVMPDYFRIGGINSPIFMEFAIVTVYALNYRTITKAAGIWIFALITASPVSLALLSHGNYKSAIHVIIEKIILLMAIYSELDNMESFSKLIDAVLKIEAIECIAAYVHFVFDFNVFSLLSNTTDTAVLGADTQYRNGFPRVEGSLGHAITFAMYISICALLALYMYRTTKKKKYIFVYNMSIVALLLTQARFPLIVFLISQICYIFTLNPKKALRILFKVIGILVSALLMMMLFFPNAISVLSIIFKMFVQLFSAASLSGIRTYNDESAFAYRFEMIRIIPQLIKDNLLFGINIEKGFSFKIGAHYQTSIDNQYLYSMVISGICGLFSTVYWLIAPLCVKSKMPYKFLFWARMAIVVYAINLLSVAEMNEKRLVLILIALIFASKKIQKRNSKETAKKRSDNERNIYLPPIS